MNMHPISEIVVVAVSFITAGSSYLMLGNASTPAVQQYQLQWFLMPLLGSLLSSASAMLMNPRPEARKVVIARSIFSIVVGTCVPKVISMFHPAIKDWAVDPAISFLAGFGICMFAYIISRPFVEKLYGNADGMGEHLANQIEKKQKLLGNSCCTFCPRMLLCVLTAI